jgi:hypothetical protein
MTFSKLKLILDDFRKNIEIMWELIGVSLYRYIYIHESLAFIVVRQVPDNQYLYEKKWPSGVSWDVISNQRTKHQQLINNVIVDAKKICVEYYKKFQGLISTLEIELIELSAQFQKRNSVFFSTDESDEYSNFLHVFELEVLSKKEKYLFFKKEFENFQKQTQDVLQEILDEDYEYEMRGCGDSSELMAKIEYTEPLAEIKILIKTMNAVLSNECQKDCGCHLPKSYWSSPQFTHKPIVLTPEMNKKIGQCFEKLEELFE